MRGFIYSLTKGDNDIFYIGCSTQPELRAKYHKTNNRYLDETTGNFVYYDTFEFTMEIVDELEFKWREELMELEDYWIHQFKNWGFNLKNVTYRMNNFFKVPNDILLLFKSHSPHINPYRTSETTAFLRTLYDIIRDLQSEINKK